VSARKTKDRNNKRQRGKPIEERSIVSARRTKDRNNKRQMGEPIEERSIVVVSARVTKDQNNKRQMGEPIEERSIVSARKTKSRNKQSAENQQSIDWIEISVNDYRGLDDPYQADGSSPYCTILGHYKRSGYFDYYKAHVLSTRTLDWKKGRLNIRRQ
jgi:hypothetical protein